MMKNIFALIIKIPVYVYKWACISTHDCCLHNIIPCGLLIIFDFWNFHSHHWLPIFSYTNSLGQLLPSSYVLIPQAQNLKSCSCGVKENDDISVSYFLIRNVYMNLKEDVNNGYQNQTTQVQTCLSTFCSIFIGWYPGPGSGRAAVAATFRISLPCL